MRLLVIEDNPKMAEFIRQGFAEQGYAVDVVATAREGEACAPGGDYDCIVLDVMLPDQDGLTTCRRLRQHGVHVPILMLTALGSTSDKVAGLEAGADDYLTKPFEFVELVARVRALIRRRQTQETTTLKFEDLEMDLLSRQVSRAGQKIRLTTKEFAMLETFIRNANRVLTRTEISERVWDMDFDAESNVIDVYVSSLRRKIDKGFGKPLIHTVIGTGYCMRSATSA